MHKCAAQRFRVSGHCSQRNNICSDNPHPVDCETSVRRGSSNRNERFWRRRAERGEAAADAERGGRDRDDPGQRAAEGRAALREAGIAAGAGGLDRHDRGDEVQGGGWQAEEAVRKWRPTANSD